MVNMNPILYTYMYGYWQIGSGDDVLSISKQGDHLKNATVPEQTFLPYTKRSTKIIFRQSSSLKLKAYSEYAFNFKLLDCVTHANDSFRDL